MKLISQYVSDQGYADIEYQENAPNYVLLCYDRTKELVKRDYYTSQQQAEDCAEDWVTCH
jgi:hypothetical protein